MGRDVRIAAGLGEPPSQFTNQRNESLNNVVKCDIGVSTEEINQCDIHDKIYENVIVPQQNEVIKAIYNEGEYKLYGPMQKIGVTPYEWSQKTADQRSNLIQKVMKCIPPHDHCEPHPEDMLSVNYNDLGLNFVNIAGSLLRKMWTDAAFIKKDVMKGEDFYIIPVPGQTKCYFVTLHTNQTGCTCKQFDRFKICPHLLAVSDVAGTLQSFVDQFSYDDRQMSLNFVPVGAGEKRNKKPRLGKQCVFSKPIERVVPNESLHVFSNSTNLNVTQNNRDLNIIPACQPSKVYHNDNKWNLVFADTVKHKDPKCIGCQAPVSVIQPSPADIIFCHKERFEYPDKRKGGQIVTSFKEMHNKLYHIRRSCILPRHPYFHNGLVFISKETLERIAPIHKAFLDHTLGLKL